MVMQGFGVFVRRNVKVWDAAEASRRATAYRAARVRWVSLMVESVDSHVTDLDDLERAAEVMREEGGMEVGVWCFPNPTAPASRTLDRLRAACERVRPSSIILDVEAYRGVVPAAETVREVVRGARALSSGAACSSYPVPAWHRTMPWAEMLTPGIVRMPQLYQTGLSPRDVERALRAWGGPQETLVPALPAYDVSNGKLKPVDQLIEIATRVVLDPRTKRPRVQGAVLWSDPQIDALERRALADMAERWGW